MASVEIIPLIIIIAIVIGFLASLFGIGGGFLIVPTEVFLLSMDTHRSIGTSTFIIIFMSASAVLGYRRQKRIDYCVAGILLFASIPGTIVGGIIGKMTSAQLLILLFGVIEMILAIILALRKTPEKELTKILAGACKIEEEVPSGKWWILSRHIIDAEGKREDYKANLLLAFPLSFLAGFLATFLGIGGGTINIQILYFCCGMGIHVTIASSMFMIFFSSISGSLTQFALGEVDVVVGLLFAIGIVIGAQIGTRINKRIASQKLKIWAAIIIIVIAVNMIIDSFFIQTG